MRKLTIFFAFSLMLFLISAEVFASAQWGDVLFLDSQEYSIQTNPLELFFEANPEKRPESDILGTNLERGYLATWDMSAGYLYLIDVQILWREKDAGPFETELHSVMKDIFQNQNRVFASWFTGYIIAPYGKLTEYVHMGYASTYENYRVFTVVNGVLKAERQMTAEQFCNFRKTQFHAYQQTDEYAAAFKRSKEAITWKKQEEDNDTSSNIIQFLFEQYGARYMSIIFDPEKLR